jgi:hypothetical protein
VTGGSGLQIQVYAVQGGGATVSTSTPLVRVSNFAYIGPITPFSTWSIPVTINAGSGVPPMVAGQVFAIAIEGNNHVWLNQSSASGLYTLPAGGPPTSLMPASFTSQGTAVGTQLYFCGSASFQYVVTVTATVTQPATTTATATVSTTVPVNTSNPATSAFWYFPLFYMMLGAGVFTAFGVVLNSVRQRNGG